MGITHNNIQELKDNYRQQLKLWEKTHLQRVINKFKSNPSDALSGDIINAFNEKPRLQLSDEFLNGDTFFKSRDIR